MHYELKDHAWCSCLPECRYLLAVGRTLVHPSARPGHQVCILCVDAMRVVATHHGPAQLLVVRTRPGHARCAARPQTTVLARPGRPPCQRELCCQPVSARWPEINLISFYIFYLIKFKFKFKNSYQIEYLYKIYETSSVRFLNSSSIHEKYKTKQ
jgi:hypothetical protein